MPLTTTRRTGLVEQVIEQMREAIRTGDWAVDQRIPPEPELVTVLGVGSNLLVRDGGVPGVTIRLGEP